MREGPAHSKDKLMNYRSSRDVRDKSAPGLGIRALQGSVANYTSPQVSSLAILVHLFTGEIICHLNTPPHR